MKPRLAVMVADALLGSKRGALALISQSRPRLCLVVCAQYLSLILAEGDKLEPLSSRIEFQNGGRETRIHPEAPDAQQRAVSRVSVHPFLRTAGGLDVQMASERKAKS